MLETIKAYAALILFVVGLLLGWLANGWRLNYASEKKEAAANLAIANANAHSADLQMLLDQSHVTVVSQTITLKSEIPDVVNHFVPTPGAPVQDRPAYYLTAGAVSVWNSALTLPSTSSGPVGSPSSGSTPDSLLLTDVTFEDALSNHVLNAARCLDLESQVRGWQEWWKGVPH